MPSSILTPTQLTGNVNDYDPADGIYALTFRLSSDASREITGFAGGFYGATKLETRMVFFENIGSQNIVLRHQNGSSAEVNRFAISTGASLTIGPGETVQLLWDSISERWRNVGA